MMTFCIILSCKACRAGDIDHKHIANDAHDRRRRGGCKPNGHASSAPPVKSVTSATRVKFTFSTAGNRDHRNCRIETPGEGV